MSRVESYVIASFQTRSEWAMFSATPHGVGEQAAGSVLLYGS